MAAPGSDGTEKKSPLQEITQPFKDFARAPRALWGINVAYVLEGLVYFGILGYLAMHFSDFIFQGVDNPDVHSHHMVMILTAGITISMFFLGSIADKKGVRRTLLTAFCFLLGGRILISLAPVVFDPAGMWSSLHIMTIAGILVVVIGYGMYQPAAYAGVRKYTSPKTAAMGYAMLYALMNLGGWFPSFAFYLRDEQYLGLGIQGVFWVYTTITLIALVITFMILTPKVENVAIARAEAESAEEKKKAESEGKTEEEKPKEDTANIIENTSIPIHLWVCLAVILGLVCWFAPQQVSFIIIGAVIVLFAVPKLRAPSVRWLANHPLSNTKFFFFIFALIPVQTLFTYNWLILPQYIERAFPGWIGARFELFANANPILIFIAVPIIAAATQKKNVYNMMVIGTFVMAAPAFFLVLGTSIYTLIAYLLVMTIGEAMWQPRFLQYAAEIAPEGRTGAYMGVAQFPWFLTKVLAPLYTGTMIQRFCPAEGDRNPEQMWLYFAIIAMMSTVLLIVAKGWVGKDFKTKA